VEPVALKEVTPLTGYVRGGVTALLDCVLPRDDSGWISTSPALCSWRFAPSAIRERVLRGELEEFRRCLMTQPRGFPSWEELYKQDIIEKLPWYWPALDPDLDAALGRHGISSGRVLDQGTGPGTQAIALAERGFMVTACDLSTAAIAYAARRSKERGVEVTFVQDDILASLLTGPFEVVFDRGCFHVLAPEQRAGYVETTHRLLAPSGWLFIKTFSHHQPGEQGPHRFAPEDLRRTFGDRFDVVEILEAGYQGQLDPYPKALFATFRRKG
jgi:2-polyprenyl-3-methyl-5-hydroxy-6-metoxy-1,4-benzoquinol methylase